MPKKEKHKEPDKQGGQQEKTEQNSFPKLIGTQGGKINSLYASLQQAVGNQSIIKRSVEIGEVSKLKEEKLARLENANPILANSRFLLNDTANLIRGRKREAVGKKMPERKKKQEGIESNQEGDEREGLLDTTYDSVADNLILDINMVFEENLQRLIEHNPHFVEKIKEIVQIIHGNVKLESVDPDSRNLKKDRIEWVLKFISEKVNRNITMKDLEDANWNLNEAQKISDAELKRKTIGYIKLLKMLKTQHPYFGGSTEYEHNETDKLEYWVYHMSTLTKDPDRQYAANEQRASFVKPMKDYRTHQGGLVPHHNQRNLGTGIVELAWNELPESISGLITTTISALYDDPSKVRKTVKSNAKSKEEEQPSEEKQMDAEEETKEESDEEILSEKRKWFDARLKHSKEMEKKYSKGARRSTLDKLFINKKIDLKGEKPTTAHLEELWNKCTEEERKSIFGDVLMLPWSRAHIKRMDNTPENVAGVMGNILEIPKVARQRYVKDLKKISDSSKMSDPWQMFRHEGAKETDEKLDEKKLLDEFEKKHAEWYEKAKKYHKPIIGGISGHTLGYLNLYEEALAKAKEKKNQTGQSGQASQSGQTSQDSQPKKHPTMETLRAIMLGALIGDKRHHSYDEVMTASHGIPTHEEGGGTLQYKHPESYKDVLESGEAEIKKAAEAARKKTGDSVDNPEKNTVLHIIREDVYAKVGNQAGFADLQNQLKAKYIDKGFEHHEGLQAIKESVDKQVADLVAKQKKLDDSKKEFLLKKRDSEPPKPQAEVKKLDDSKKAPYMGTKEEKPSGIPPMLNLPELRTSASVEDRKKKFEPRQ